MYTVSQEWLRVKKFLLSNDFYGILVMKATMAHRKENQMPAQRRTNSIATTPVNSPVNGPQNGSVNEPNNGDDDWDEVSAESQIVFDTRGDQFIGRFMGMDNLGSSNIYQAHFEGYGKDAGENYFTNAGYDLRKKLEKVPPKTLVRITYIDDKDTGQAQPMRVYKVDQKR